MSIGVQVAVSLLSLTQFVQGMDSSAVSNENTVSGKDEMETQAQGKHFNPFYYLK